MGHGVGGVQIGDVQASAGHHGRGRRLGVVVGALPAGHDARDVVVTAALVGEIDQALGDHLDVVRVEEVGELVILDEIRQAVGAEQDAVALLQGPRSVELRGGDDRLGGRPPAERAGHDVGEGGLSGLLRGELPRVDQVLDQLVVAGAAEDGVASNPVRPTVAHPGHVGRGIVDPHDHRGGTGLGTLVYVEQSIAEDGVGGLECLGQVARDALYGHVGQRVPQHLHREAARLVAAPHAAHSVTDREQRPPVLGSEDGERIFVALVHPTRVGPARKHQICLVHAGVLGLPGRKIVPEIRVGQQDPCRPCGCRRRNVDVSRCVDARPRPPVR